MAECGRLRQKRSDKGAKRKYLFPHGYVGTASASLRRHQRLIKEQLGKRVKYFHAAQPALMKGTQRSHAGGNLLRIVWVTDMGVLIVTRDLIPRLCAQCHDALRDARGRQKLIDRLLIFAVDQTLRALSIAAKNILFSIRSKEERIIRHTFLQRQKNPFGGTLPKMQANRPSDQLLLRFIHRIHSSFLHIRETLIRTTADETRSKAHPHLLKHGAYVTIKPIRPEIDLHRHRQLQRIGDQEHRKDDAAAPFTIRLSGIELNERFLQLVLSPCHRITAQAQWQKS